MDAVNMSVGDKVGGCLVDLGGSFTEDAPRPPVPGEEGELVSSDGRPYSHGFYSFKSESLKNEASTATPRRPDLDLGYEPEGSASPTPPYLKWAESLHSLLDDQDGIHLFRTFLKQEECADMLDFWFACTGFRKLEANEGQGEEKKLKLAKAIYKKYILDNNGIVSRQIKPATKSFIKDCVMRLHIDPAMFDQAQTEIQTMMEENTYPLFLKSDIYLEYTRTGGESPKLYSDQSSVSGGGKVLPGYLPTLNEDEEWRCDHELEEQQESDPSNRLTQKLLQETASQRVTSTKRFQDSHEYRRVPWREPVNPYYVNSGYAMAPATSANDSEQQSMSSASDVDTLSLTDSSVDGVPPYKYRKQHRREMHESAKANGHVPLPHIPEEEGEDADISTSTSFFSHRLPPGAHPQHYNNPRYSDIGYNGLALRPDAHEENPESILDDHVQRVMKTPGCQSPGTGRHSPKSRSPDGFPAGGKVPGPGMPLPTGPGKHPARLGPKGEAASHQYHHKHVHHIHHPAGGKPKEQVEADAATRVNGNFHWGMEQHNYGSKSRNYADGMGPSPMDPMGYSSKGSTLSKRPFKKAEEVRTFEVPVPPEDVERNQKILQWMMEGEAVRNKKSPYGSTTGSKKTPSSHEVSRPSSVERPGAVHPWVSAQLRNSVQPSHPFIQDPTMPPNPAPNPLTQLEEARRRLEEEKKKTGTLQTKQRYVMEVIQRGRAAARPALFPPLGVVPAVSDTELSEYVQSGFTPVALNTHPISHSSTQTPIPLVTAAPKPPSHWSQQHPTSPPPMSITSSIQTRLLCICTAKQRPVCMTRLHRD
ncbi:axin-1-like isoform X4 [Oncorhynchus masou masou]|uniref:axin-1-like isoform X4 n=1 Tax=Oncorhynchus masou masou TaxID=90313 RepID=UPI003183AB90